MSALEGGEPGRWMKTPFAEMKKRLSGTAEQDRDVESVFPMSKEAASWLFVFRPIERVYERDVLTSVVSQSGSNSASVQAIPKYSAAIRKQATAQVCGCSC